MFNYDFWVLIGKTGKPKWGWLIFESTLQTNVKMLQRRKRQYFSLRGTQIQKNKGVVSPIKSD